MAILTKLRTFSWVFACFFTLSVTAQEKLIVGGKAPDMYVVYNSNGTESLQNISNGFGLSTAKLLAYNKININAAATLPKGTPVKIPFTKDNLLQQPGENSGPVVHILKKGENLYRLSLMYNKVPVASLREWNHLKKDIVKDGQPIIIGYMVNATAEKKQDLPKDIVAVNTTSKAPVPEKLYTDKKQPPLPSPVEKEKVVDRTPVIVSKDIIKPENKTASKEIVKKEDAFAEYVPREGDEGYFAGAYPLHAKEQTKQFHSGDAAIFKTISGWTDRKFYVLMNDIAPRTIVRITSPSNKNICAMVLGPLQETKGANGLLLRLSNSAASALGITDPKFTVTVTYFE